MVWRDNQLLVHTCPKIRLEELLQGLVLRLEGGDLLNTCGPVCQDLVVCVRVFVHVFVVEFGHLVPSYGCVRVYVAMCVFLRARVSVDLVVGHQRLLELLPHL